MKPLGHHHNTGFGESIFVKKNQLSRRFKERVVGS
jgi:hypothetical protein